MTTQGPVREAQDPLWPTERPLGQKKGPLGSKDGPLSANTWLVMPKEGHLWSIQGPQITRGLVRPNRMPRHGMLRHANTNRGAATKF